jgi:hypothetical protein
MFLNQYYEPNLPDLFLKRKNNMNKSNQQINSLLSKVAEVNKSLLVLQIENLNLKLNSFGRNSNDFFEDLQSGKLSLTSEETKLCKEHISKLIYLNKELFKTEKLQLSLK